MKSFNRGTHSFDEVFTSSVGGCQVVRPRDRASMMNAIGVRAESIKIRRPRLLPGRSLGDGGNSFA